MRAGRIALIAGLVLAGGAAGADVVRDGRVGSAGAGAVASEVDGAGGIRHLIRESDGQLRGQNLFHSFSRLNLTSNETAVYQGDADIRNLVTTITGGRSSIDGKLESEIAGANLFLINPDGVVFGENATVDLSGAFTVSTAERLIFSNGEQVETSGAAPPTILSVADPVGFGFIDAPASIRVQGSRIQLLVQPSLKLIGGDIEILGGRSDDDGAFIAVRSGRIDLVSLASAGQVEIVPDGIRISGNPRFGDITIADDVVVTSGGAGVNALDEFNQGLVPAPGSGPIYMRANDLLIRDADLRTTTVSSRSGGDISIDLSGRLTVEGSERDTLTGIFSETGLNVNPAPGQVVEGVIFLILFERNGDLIGEVAFDLCGGRACGAHYFATGDAGDVRIRAQDVRLLNGGRISAGSQFSGDAGTIDIGFDGEMSVVGRRGPDQISLITTNASGTGNPGAIRIHSDSGKLRMDDFGALVIQNGRSSLDRSLPGQIFVDVAELEMSGNARIDSSTRGEGPGGVLDIRARDQMTLRGRSDDENFTGISTFSQPDSQGAAGEIHIATANLLMEDGAEISARKVNDTSLGAAGNLRFEIGDRLVMRDAIISTESPNSAGGNIDLSVLGVVDMLRSSIRTNVISGPENAGNITLRPGPDALVLDHSQIIAGADTGIGTGGFIDLEAGVVITDQSTIDAPAGPEGVAGVVLINGVEGNIVPEVASLATPASDASSLLREPCAARRPGASNRFVIDERRLLAVDADDYLAAPLGALLGARESGTDDGAGAKSKQRESDLSEADVPRLVQRDGASASGCTL